jgi:serine protease SohB
LIEFLIEYGMFLAKSVTLVLLFLLVFGGVLFLYSRTKPISEDHLEVKKLNEKYENMGLALKSVTLSNKAFKQELKILKTRNKQDQKGDLNEERKKVYVLNFKGDVQASEVSSLRESITALLTVAKPSDEVVVLLESTGGTVHDYGFAASQLQRVRNKNIMLTVAVDKVAASGGYMMACVADHIIAAPFAIIGSIGVIGQMPNFNRLLKKMDIDFEQMTAGEYKRTLNLFGENTEKGRLKAQEEIESTHQLFKEFIVENRPKMDIETIATGEHWYGKPALVLNLVDELSTSDDYLCAAAQQADLLMVSYSYRKSFFERLFSSFS